jgi:hypothetical protein
MVSFRYVFLRELCMPFSPIRATFPAKATVIDLVCNVERETITAQLRAVPPNTVPFFSFMGLGYNQLHEAEPFLRKVAQLSK